jgi:uracil-DNA glycosylase family 4
VIQGHGSTHPKAFFIADSPTNEDVTKNYALMGYTGNLLATFCREQGLNLEDFWRTCLIKEPLNKETEADETKLKPLVDQYAPILINEINELRPNLLIPLGEISFNYLTGLNSIRKFRGSVLPLNGSFAIENENTKVLPILGPNPFLNQEYKLRYITRIDFTKIGRNIYDTPIPDNVHNIWVARSSTALRAFFDRNYQRTIDSGGFLTFDIETYYQIPICISFCFDGFESVTVPLVDKSVDFDNRVLMMDLVARILASPIPKVNQNIKYDWRIMERWGFPVNNIAGDTMLAASTLYCEFPKGLGFLTSIYTDLPYFKDEGKSFDPDRSKRDRYYLYNAKDSLATSQIYTKQLVELAELGTAGVYRNLMACMPIYKKMEDRGIRIDEEERDKLLANYESHFYIENVKIKQLLNRQYFNPLSPKQCKEVIFDELGYSKIRGLKTNKDGTPGTDEENLELLRIYGEAKRAPSTGPAILDAIIAARKFHKVIEVLELHLHPDSRFRCEFNLAGTETGRTSAGQTTDQLLYFENGKIKTTNLGHSLQTIGKHGFMSDGVTYGKDLRRMFVPSNGFRFVEIDLSGAEARVDRVLSGVFDMDVFDYPGIHKLTGSWIYDCAPKDIKKNVLDADGVDRYHMSKTVRHAGERNMGGERMVMMTQRPLQECNRILMKFHQYQPEIKDTFHRQIIQAIDAPTHCLIAPNGRRRDFFDRIDKHTYNEGISFLPQAIVSDQTKFYGIVPTFSDPSISSFAYPLAEMHDGVLAEVRIGRELEYARAYKKNIEVGIDFRSCTLSRDYVLNIPAEVSVGENWFYLEEVKDV